MKKTKNDQFAEKRQRKGVRTHGYRKTNINSFLIVTEGKCTEPAYFEGLKNAILAKRSGNIEVVSVDVRGEGCGTTKLIKAANKHVKNSKVIYQNVWVVFDKDKFIDFDEAITYGEKKNYKIAWSNISFEYWIYLHFAYATTNFSTEDLKEKLNSYFKNNNLGSGRYEKNDENIYEELNSIGGVDKAIKNAERRMKEFKKGCIAPSKFAPGTTVYELVKVLRSYIE